MKYSTFTRFQHRQRIGNLCVICGKPSNAHPTASYAPYRAYWFGSDLLTCGVVHEKCINQDSEGDDDDYELN